MSTPWIVAFIVQWIVVIATAVVVIGLLRRTAAALEAAEASREAPVSLGGIPIASRAPDFTVYEATGTHAGPHAGPARITAEELLDGPTILLFMEQHCPPCRQLASEIAPVFEQGNSVNLRVVLDEEDGTPHWLPDDVPVVYQRERELSHAFQNSASPQAYLLDGDRLVLAKRIVRSIDDLREMSSVGESMGGDGTLVQLSG